MEKSDINRISAWAIPGVRADDNPRKPPEQIAENIIHSVCDFYGLDDLQVRSKSRKQELTLARQFCMYFIRNRTYLSLKRIAGMFSGRDHTTAIHSIAYITEQINSKYDNDVKDDYLQLIKQIP